LLRWLHGIIVQQHTHLHVQPWPCRVR
jgi:hypothetical protein